MKKIHTRALSLILSASLAFSLVACGGSPAGSDSSDSGATGSDASSSQPAADPIRIGAVLSQTGTNVHGGTQALNAMQMLVEEVNANGGVKGHPLELLVENSNSEAEQAVNGALKLTNEENVLAILGPDNGTTATAIKEQVAEVYEIPQISVVGSSPKLTADKPTWFFRGATPSTYQTVELANYLVNDMGMKRIAILCDDSLTDQADSFIADLAALEMENVSLQTHATGNTNFNGQLLATANADPDTIMFIGYPTECASALRQATDMGLDVQWAGSIGTVYNELIELAGDLANGFIGTIGFTATNPREDVQAFVQKYEELYDEVPEHTAGQAYDQLSLVIKALEECNVSLAEADVASDRALIRDWLENDANGFDGLAGVIQYTPEEHTAYTSINLMIVENGNWNVLRASGATD